MWPTSMLRPALACALFLLSPRVLAAIPDSGLLNDVTDQFLTHSATWGAAIIQFASWIFWILASISMVWTFGLMALRKADIGEFFSEFIRFTVTTGFFWWLLSNGPNMAMAIIKSLRQVGATAGGLPNILSPSTPVSIGFDIVKKAFNGLSWVHPIDNLAIVIVTAAIVLCMAVVAANVLIALVTGWTMAYAGTFILGFGGSRWTSDMAIGYFRAMLAIGLELMTMTLLVGIATSVVDGFYRDLDGSSVYELLLVLCVCAVLALLIDKIPERVARLAGGGLAGGGSGASFGAASILGAAAVAGAAAATAGGALAAGATSMAGGAQALMAAYSKASASDNAGGGGGGGGGNLMSGVSGGGGGGDSDGSGSTVGSSLASAMGEAEAVGGGGSRSFGGTDASQSAGVVTGSGASTLAGRSGNSGSSANGGKSGVNAEAGSSPKRDGANPATHTRTDSKAVGDHGRSPGEVPPSSALAAAGAIAAKIGRMAGGTAASLAQGSWDVARAKVSDVTGAAMDRIGETTGGKIAAAIKARDEMSRSGTGAPSTFDGGSLSAGTSEPADVDAEVAAFRDRS